LGDVGTDAIAYIGNFINKADLGRQNAFAAYLIISAELMSVTTIGTGGKMDQRQTCAPQLGIQFLHHCDRFGIIAP